MCCMIYYFIQITKGTHFESHMNIIKRHFNYPSPSESNRSQFANFVPIDLWMMQTNMEWTIFRGFSLSSLRPPLLSLTCFLCFSMRVCVCLHISVVNWLLRNMTYVVLLYAYTCISKECIKCRVCSTNRTESCGDGGNVGMLEPEHSIWNLLYWVVVTFTSQDKLHILRKRANAIIIIIVISPLLLLLLLLLLLFN